MKKEIGEYIKILSGYPFNSDLFNEENIGKPLIRIRDLERSYSKTYFNGEYEETYIISNGDILVGMDGDFNAVKWKGIDSLLNQRICKIETEENVLDKEFMYQSLQSELNKIHRKTAATTVKHLSTKDIKKIKIFFPPLEEQKKIADILSTVDKKIAFVEENINATEELKKGLMQKLLTEGIGHTEFKDSELGRIPESWEIVKLEDCIIGKGQYGINAAAVDFNEKLPRYLRITDIDDSGNFIKENSKSVDTTEIDTFSLNENDIVFARTGNTTGKTYLYNKKDGELIFAGFLIRFTPNQDILDSRYLKLYTETSDYWKWVKVMSTRTGQPGINSNEYGKLSIKFPSLEEQKQIAEILSTVDNKLENLKEKKQSFEELKKGLMQKLLTGEVRV